MLFYTKIRIETKVDKRVYEFIHSEKEINWKNEYPFNSFSEKDLKMQILECYQINPVYCLGGQIKDK